MAGETSRLWLVDQSTVHLGSFNLMNSLWSGGKVLLLPLLLEYMH